MAIKNADPLNFFLDKNLKLAKSLKREVKFIGLLILMLNNLKLQLTKPNWMFGQYECSPVILKIFYVVWVEILSKLI